MKVRPTYIACGVGFALQFCCETIALATSKGLNQIVKPNLPPRKTMRRLEPHQGKAC
jgi:hypothetical protein